MKKSTTISEACDKFEKKYMLDRSDPRFCERMRSPTLEEERYPSIEHSTHLQNDPFDDHCDPGFSGGTNRPASGQAERQQYTCLSEADFPPSSQPFTNFNNSSASIEEKYSDLLANFQSPTDTSSSSPKTTSVPAKREESVDLDLHSSSSSLNT